MNARWSFVVAAACAGGLWNQVTLAQDDGSQPAPAAESPADANAANVSAAPVFGVDFDSLSNSVLLQNSPGLLTSWNESSGALGLFLSTAYANPFGVDVAAVDAALRAQLYIADDAGVVVTRVADDSAAAKAGLKPHDVVLRIGEAAVAGPEQFNEVVVARQGEEATFHVLRRGQPVEVKVTIPKPPHYYINNNALDLSQLYSVDNRQVSHYRIGVTLAEADDTLRSQLRLASGEGLVVTEVIGDGPAAAAGIRTHDVLIKLDGKRLSTVDGVNAQIQEIGERAVTLDYIRAGEEQTCEVTPRLSQGTTYRTVTRLLPYAAQGRIAWDINGGSANGALIRWLNVADSVNDAPGERDARNAAAEQISEIKRRLDEISKSLDALGATLQAQSGANSPAQESPAKQSEQPKPEE